MKYLKILLIIILTLSFTMFSCKKDSTTGPGGGGTIVGTWQVIDGIVGWLLTTNSNQVATNMFNVTGQINVTGTVNATFDFMILDDSTNPPSFILGNITGGNNDIVVFLDGSNGEGMVIVTTADQTFLGDVTFSYSNGSLIVTQSTIQDVASDDTVTISGTLSYSQTNIPANTPTFLEFVADDEGEGGVDVSTIEFRNDGTATVTDTDEFGTETENWTYVTDGNQMTITDEYGDTMLFEYTINGNTLNLIASDFEDACIDYDNQAECFADMELFFMLDQGSLTDIKVRVEIILNKVAAKSSLMTTVRFNSIRPNETISKYFEKVKQLKDLN